MVARRLPRVPIFICFLIIKIPVRLIVNSLTELLKIERDLLNKSGNANDEGTNSMMSDFITEQEKTVWMMKAWLNETV